MLVSYTPDQQLLFDQDPAHWTEDPVPGWYVHAHGARFEITTDAGNPYSYSVFNAQSAIVASVGAPDHLLNRPPSALDGLLDRLRATFSAAHRQALDAFVHHLAVCILQHGGSGLHTVFLPEAEGFGHDLDLYDAEGRGVDLDLPDAVRDVARTLTWIPMRPRMDVDVLVSSYHPRICIPVPTSAHGLLALRAHIQATYGWAHA